MLMVMMLPYTQNIENKSCSAAPSGTPPTQSVQTDKSAGGSTVFYASYDNIRGFPKANATTYTL
jgi:hypothetical protein